MILMILVILMILILLILWILRILGTPTSDSYELLRISYYSNAFVHI